MSVSYSLECLLLRPLAPLSVADSRVILPSSLCFHERVRCTKAPYQHPERTQEDPFMFCCFLHLAVSLWVPSSSLLRSLWAVGSSPPMPGEPGVRVHLAGGVAQVYCRVVFTTGAAQQQQHTLPAAPAFPGLLVVGRERAPGTISTQ